MNYVPGNWYNELYRIFADGSLLTVAQSVMLGQCLRSIQAGENAEYHLNELYYSFGVDPRSVKVKEALDEYIHAYIKHYKEDIYDAEDGTETAADEPRCSISYGNFEDPTQFQSI